MAGVDRKSGSLGDPGVKSTRIHQLMYLMEAEKHMKVLFVPKQPNQSERPCLSREEILPGKRVELLEQVIEKVVMKKRW